MSIAKVVLKLRKVCLCVGGPVLLYLAALCSVVLFLFEVSCKETHVWMQVFFTVSFTHSFISSFT